MLGRIAEMAASHAPVEGAPKRNKVDDILDALDDEDRAIVLGWLHDRSVGSQQIHYRLLEADINCSHYTVQRWRHYNGLA